MWRPWRLNITPFPSATPVESGEADRGTLDQPCNGAAPEPATDTSPSGPCVRARSEQRKPLPSGYVAAVPAQTFTGSATAKTPVEVVWASIDDVATWESVATIDKVTDARRDHSGRLTGFDFVTHVAGAAQKGVAKAVHRAEGKAIWRHVESSEITGVELSSTGDDTEIKVTLDVSNRGFLAEMFFPGIVKKIGDGLAESVRQISTRFG